jgi:hypothetical protein
MPVEGTWWATVTYRKHYYDAQGATPISAIEKLFDFALEELPSGDDRSQILKAIDVVAASLNDADRLRREEE